MVIGNKINNKEMECQIWNIIKIIIDFRKIITGPSEKNQFIKMIIVRKDPGMMIYRLVLLSKIIKTLILDIKVKSLIDLLIEFR